MKKLCSVLFLFSCLFLSPVSGEEKTAAVSPEMSCLRWDIEALPQRVTDGGMSVVFILRMPEQVPDTEPEVWCRSVRWSHEAVRKKLRPPKPRIFKKELLKEDGLYKVRIYSGTSQKMELFARAYFHGKMHLAQTIFSISGSSQLPDQGIQEADELPFRQELHLKGSERFFRAEAETPLVVDFRGVENVPASMDVFDRTGKLLAEPENLDGTFSYTPPFDRYLRNAGYRGRNHVIFQAVLSDGTVMSSYILVHRARGGITSYKAGLSAAAGSMAVFGLGVFIARRRFKY